MAVPDVLSAFALIMAVEFPDITFLTTTPAIPYPGPYPVIILTEYQQNIIRKFTGLRGQDGGTPNVYSYVYLQATPSEVGTTLSQSVATLRANIERFVGLFDNPNYITLNGTVTLAGDVMTVEYDRSGHFVNYLGKLHVGCSGVIEIWEPYRPTQTIQKIG